MQRYTLFFIIVNAVHFSGGFSAHHQELKSCTRSICYVPGLFAATANMVELELVCMRYWMCETALNMYSIDNNKEYCIKLHLVGWT